MKRTRTEHATQPTTVDHWKGLITRALESGDKTQREFAKILAGLAGMNGASKLGISQFPPLAKKAFASLQSKKVISVAKDGRAHVVRLSKDSKVPEGPAASKDSRRAKPKRGAKPQPGESGSVDLLDKVGNIIQVFNALRHTTEEEHRATVAEVEARHAVVIATLGKIQGLIDELTTAVKDRSAFEGRLNELQATLLARVETIPRRIAEGAMNTLRHHLGLPISLPAEDRGAPPLPAPDERPHAPVRPVDTVQPAAEPPVERRRERPTLPVKADVATGRERVLAVLGGAGVLTPERTGG